MCEESEYICPKYVLLLLILKMCECLTLPCCLRHALKGIADFVASFAPPGRTKVPEPTLAIVAKAMSTRRFHFRTADVDFRPCDSSRVS